MVIFKLLYPPIKLMSLRCLSGDRNPSFSLLIAKNEVTRIFQQFQGKKAGGVGGGGCSFFFFFFFFLSYNLFCFNYFIFHLFPAIDRIIIFPS